MFVAQMDAKIEGLAQSCPRLLNVAFQHRECLNSANPESATAEFLATAARTAILVKFIRDRLDLSRTGGTSLAAWAARTHIPALSRRRCPEVADNQGSGKCVEGRNGRRSTPGTPFCVWPRISGCKPSERALAPPLADFRQ
jgi:hypothetical protein